MRHLYINLGFPKFIDPFVVHFYDRMVENGAGLQGRGAPTRSEKVVLKEANLKAFIETCKQLGCKYRRIGINEFEIHITEQKYLLHTLMSDGKSKHHIDYLWLD